MDPKGIIGPVVALAVTVLVFLILRFFVLWYWRINEQIELLKSIDRRLAALAGNRDPRIGELP